MTDTGPAENPNLEQLRAKAERVDALEQQLAERDRADTFAGLKIDEGPGKMLADLYKPQDGMSRAGFEEFARGYGVELSTISNVAPPPEPAPEPAAAPQAAQPVTTAEAQHFDTQAQLGGAVVNQEPPQDLIKQGWQEHDQALANGVRPEVAKTGMLQSIFGAAAAGDPNALYDQAEWRARHQ